MGKNHAKANPHAADPHADLESDSGDAPDESRGNATFNSPVRVTFHHYRKRLADIDGLSGKAALDGLVLAKVLQGDSPKFVEEVRHRQSKCDKGEPERTEIVIEEI